MKMTDMSITADERSKMMEPTMACAGDAPRYPWGLSVSLDNASLEKLGLSDDMPEVGEKLQLTAVVEVTSCSMNETKDGGKNYSCALQITKMGLGPAPKKDAAEALYK